LSFGTFWAFVMASFAASSTMALSASLKLGLESELVDEGDEDGDAGELLDGLLLLPLDEDAELEGELLPEEEAGPLLLPLGEDSELAGDAEAGLLLLPPGDDDDGLLPVLGAPGELATVFLAFFFFFLSFGMSPLSFSSSELD
jgi:hypothetical protein